MPSTLLPQSSVEFIMCANVSNYNAVLCILSPLVFTVRIMTLHYGTWITICAKTRPNIIFMFLLIPVNVISQEKLLKKQTNRWP
jgi:hypothetical protein